MLPAEKDASSSTPDSTTGNKTSEGEAGSTTTGINKTFAGLSDYYVKTVDNLISRIAVTTSSGTGSAEVASPIGNIPAEISVAVEEIVANGLDGGGPPTDNRVGDIVWGWSTDGVYVSNQYY